jgi:hydroxylamine reductase
MRLKMKAKKPNKKITKTKSVKKAKQLITKKMLIGEIVQKHPETMTIMFEYGLHCIGCHVSAYESLEQGCLVHGLTKKQVDEMVEKMNKLVSKK